MARGDPPELRLCPDFASVVECTSDCLRVAVDMPIGLPALGQIRECDRAARRVLGPRRSSVFSAPARPYLEAREFGQVRHMSLQSFYLLPKIRQLDQWITPQSQQRVFEAHPELIFSRLAGHPLEQTKKSPAGRELRASLLPWPVPTPPGKVSQVQPDDVLDALALLWCALHPGSPRGGEQRDSRGLLMQIYGFGPA